MSGLVARVALAIVAATGVGVGGGAGTEPLEPPRIPGVDAVELGDGVSLFGSPSRIVVQEVDRSPRAVVSHFAELWRERGWVVRTLGDGVEWAAVSAFMTREGVQLLVTAQRTDGGSLVFGALMRPGPSSPRPVERLEGEGTRLEVSR